MLYKNGKPVDIEIRIVYKPSTISEVTFVRTAVEASNFIYEALQNIGENPDVAVNIAKECVRNALLNGEYSYLFRNYDVYVKLRPIN